MSNVWLIHVNKVQKKNPNLTYKQVLIKSKGTYNKQRGGNPLILAGVKTVGEIAKLGTKLTDSVHDRRVKSGFYNSESKVRALNLYKDMKWRRTHGINRLRTDSSLSDADLKRLSGLDKFI